MKKWEITDTQDQTVMEMAGTVEANTEEEAADKAIIRLGFGFMTEIERKSKSAIEVLGGLGHCVEVR